jgi:hypothetical protein
MNGCDETDFVPYSTTVVSHTSEITYLVGISFLVFPSLRMCRAPLNCTAIVFEAHKKENVSQFLLQGPGFPGRSYVKLKPLRRRSISRVHL